LSCKTWNVHRLTSNALVANATTRRAQPSYPTPTVRTPSDLRSSRRRGSCKEQQKWLPAFRPESGTKEKLSSLTKLTVVKAAGCNQHTSAIQFTWLRKRTARCGQNSPYLSSAPEPSPQLFGHGDTIRLVRQQSPPLLSRTSDGIAQEKEHLWDPVT